MLPFKTAIKLPIIIRYNTKISSCKGKIDIERKKFASIKIGFGGAGCFDKKYQRTILGIDGKIKFKDSAYIGSGTRIIVGNDASLEIGSNFTVTSCSSIIVMNKVVFGNNVLMSWEVLLLDTDFHHIIQIDSNKINMNKKPIIIGNHVWIGCRATILKGSIIDDDSVIGAGSVVSDIFDRKNILIAGVPARIMRNQISWCE